jgi:hypothetical protein
MTSGVRHDAIRIGCAVLGAVVGRFAVAPIAGGPPFVWSILGAGIGWIAARLIMRAAELRRNVAALEDAEAQKAQNDADFASASKSQGKGDLG